MLSMNKIRILTAAVAALWIVLLAPLGAGDAHAEQFGRNKVQYRTFDWKISHTEHFDIYFYEGSEDIADAAGLIAEQANEDFERVLGHKLTTVIPVIVYASHNDFRQTNVTDSHIEEGVGGFTELFKNRVVVPFTGSYEDFRHVIYHELTHVFMFDIVYGGLVESVIRQAYTNPVPLWFTEGLAEYVSQGWDTEAEMILRDLTISDRVVPLEYLTGGYLVYKEGQAVINFIAERYGEQKVAEIVRDVAKTHNLDRALRDAIGLSTPELSEEVEKWLKARYWPELADRMRRDDVAKLLTDHGKDGSYFNLGPEISPDGSKIVYVSDKSGYADVYLVSALDGERLRKLINGEQSDEFETMHLLRTGFGWSPDGSQICFVATAGASDALYLIDAETGHVNKKLRFDLDGMYTPAWSPDGEHIVFVGMKYGASDLYVTDPDGGTLERLTDDFFDERDPEWSPDGTCIAFSSDRDSTKDVGFRRTYDLYIIDVGKRDVRRVVATDGNEGQPTWSPDGNMLLYTSDRDGSSELYFADLATGKSAKATFLIGGAEAPSWSKDGNRLAFSAYGDVGWDVAMVKDPVEAFADVVDKNGWFSSMDSSPLPGAERSHVEPAAVRMPDAEEIHGDADGMARRHGGEPDSLRTGPIGAAGGDSGAPPRHAEESESVRKVREAFEAAEGAAVAPTLHSEEDERVPGTIERYRPKFSPDWISGGVGYTSGYGLSGAAQIAVSDVLGNHRFYIATDFFSSIESSNFYILYEHLARRANFSLGVYNFKDYYYSDRTRLGEDLGEKRYFTERSYGLSAGVSYPFSSFTRMELDASALSLDRQYAEENAYGEVELTDEKVGLSLVVPSARLVNDTTLWGSVGPISGGRSSISLSKAC